MSGTELTPSEGQERAAMAFALAARASACPSEDWLETLPALLGAAEDAAADFPWDISRLDLPALHSEYLQRFDRRIDGLPLTETDYGRGRAMSKGPELADIAAFYQAFGLGLGEEGFAKEAPDHLSVELEFYAWLLLKEGHLRRSEDQEGASIVEAGRRGFLADHLGPFCRALVGRPEMEHLGEYGALLSWVGRLVDQECASTGVTLTEKDWSLSPPEAEDLECAPAKAPAGSQRLPVISET